MRKGVVIGLVLGLLLGGLGGYLLSLRSNPSLTSAVGGSLMPIQAQGGASALVRPLLAYRTPEATTYGEYTELDTSLERAVANAKTRGDVSRAAVYFRDLDTARWVGANQDDTYHPASLLKVPLMIAYYKQAETEPALLREEITYHAFTNLPAFETPSALVVGRSYSVEELIRAMIIDSDNGATFTLIEHMNPEVLSAVYTALGVAEPGIDGGDYQISARTYGLFFRVLYNATYLSPASSEKALALLAKASFKDALAAGAPAGATIAHKFGEHVLTTGGTLVGIELSDCGVVYYPKHPYLLCVMASAKDEKTASLFIAGISKTAYEAVTKRYIGSDT